MRSRMLSTTIAALLATSVFSCGSEAFARSREKKEETPLVIPQCPPSMRKAAIAVMLPREQNQQGWSELSLDSPEVLLNEFMQESNCFRVVNRTLLGMNAADREFGLAQSGRQQRGSSYGKGQILAPDYYLVPYLTGHNATAGGSNLGMAAGSLLGPWGMVAGALIGSTNKQEAQVALQLVDARTLVQIYAVSATANVKDHSFGAGGATFGTTGGGALAGSAYTNTGMGRLIGVAYEKAYIELMKKYGAVIPADPAAIAPKPALTVIKTVNLRTEPSTKAKVVRSLPAGTVLYQVPVDGSGVPNETADWIKVTDDQGWYTGWVSKLFVTTSVAPSPPY